MKCICNKRCIIGEGPIWNEQEKRLYFVNGMADEICRVDIESGELFVKGGVQAAAIVFDKENNMYISNNSGVFCLGSDNILKDIYDTSEYQIRFANDMKAGPDGRIYVGTQSGKFAGVSDKIDGRLYSIGKNGDVRVLLENLILSNGMDWSMNETKFYHTDSQTGIIKEYDFNDGTPVYTGRSVKVPGVDGFTIDRNDNIYAACWGYGYIAVIDTSTMKISGRIAVPANAPASCCFCGTDMKKLSVVTASYGEDISKDPNAGYTFIQHHTIGGRTPYLFGGKI